MGLEVPHMWLPHPDARPRFAIDPRLFQQFPAGCFLVGFARLDAPAGREPESLPGLLVRLVHGEQQRPSVLIEQQHPRRGPVYRVGGGCARQAVLSYPYTRFRSIIDRLITTRCTWLVPSTIVSWRASR